MWTAMGHDISMYTQQCSSEISLSIQPHMIELMGWTKELVASPIATLTKFHQAELVAGATLDAWMNSEEQYFSTNFEESRTPANSSNSAPEFHGCNIPSFSLVDGADKPHDEHVCVSTNNLGVYMLNRVYRSRPRAWGCVFGSPLSGRESFCIPNV